MKLIKIFIVPVLGALLLSGCARTDMADKLNNPQFGPYDNVIVFARVFENSWQQYIEGELMNRLRFNGLDGYSAYAVYGEDFNPEFETSRLIEENYGALLMLKLDNFDRHYIDYFLPDYPETNPGGLKKLTARKSNYDMIFYATLTDIKTGNVVWQAKLDSEIDTWIGDGFEWIMEDIAGKIIDGLKKNKLLQKKKY
ncbi:MAG: hypothetical protein ACLFR2_13125 [Candidatus Kapaibacterium sp.]